MASKSKICLLFTCLLLVFFSYLLLFFIFGRFFANIRRFMSSMKLKTFSFLILEPEFAILDENSRKSGFLRIQKFTLTMTFRIFYTNFNLIIPGKNMKITFRVHFRLF